MHLIKTEHLKKRAPVPSTLVGEPYVSVPPPHPIVFDQLDAICIHRAVLKTSGAAGPSGLDAAAWRCICTSFQRASSDLCDALSAIARRLCATFVDALYIEGSTLRSEEGTTQGDPLAMPMYALGVLPLIDCISGYLMQVWYADDATACGSLSELRLWCSA